MVADMDIMGTGVSGSISMTCVMLCRQLSSSFSSSVPLSSKPCPVASLTKTASLCVIWKAFLYFTCWAWGRDVDVIVETANDEACAGEVSKPGSALAKRAEAQSQTRPLSSGIYPLGFFPSSVAVTRPGSIVTMEPWTASGDVAVSPSVTAPGLGPSSQPEGET
ncbi:UNVERIFIED_CONTAM: hypothetical protein FKN15_044070 [Acipenser sinensis]